MAAAHGRFSHIRQVAPMCTPYIESQKWLPWQHPLEPRNRLCIDRIAWPGNSPPRIKERVTSYHRPGSYEYVYSPQRQNSEHKSNQYSYSLQKGKKWLPWQRPLGAGYRQYMHSVDRPLKAPFITNCLVTIIHEKPINSTFSPKIGCHGNDPLKVDLGYVFIG